MGRKLIISRTSYLNGFDASCLVRAAPHCSQLQQAEGTLTHCTLAGPRAFCCCRIFVNEPCQEACASNTTRVDADLLIPGRGEPIHNGAVVALPLCDHPRMYGTTTNFPIALSFAQSSYSCAWLPRRTLTAPKANVMCRVMGQNTHPSPQVFGNGKILYSGPSSGAPSADVTVHVASGGVLMPGLWDAHVHFTGQRSTDLSVRVRVRVRIRVRVRENTS